MIGRIVSIYDRFVCIQGTGPHFLAASAQTAPELPPLSEALLNRIPADLREQARLHIRQPEDFQQRWLAMPSDELRQNVFLSLAFIPEAADFILERLPDEPSAEARANVVRNMPFVDYISSRPGARPALERIVAGDADANTVTYAIDALRAIPLKQTRVVLAERLKKAQAAGDLKMADRLIEEQERWISIEKGVMLPAFMRTVPPAFSLKPAGESVHIVAVGDYGFGNGAQKHVGDQMLARHKRNPFDFGITLGDNFYGQGMHSPDDPRWAVWWEDVYAPLGIKFYVAFGNHDWYHSDSPAAEITYSSKSPSWRMPAPYYTYTAGPIQFFVIDSNEMSVAQLAWLKAGLTASKARWKVIYGHHPIYIALEQGRPQYDKRMLDTLLPAIAGLADAYIAGHHHSLEHLKPENGLHFFIAGGGGASLYPVWEQSPQALFAKSLHGFAAISASASEFTVEFIGMDGISLYSHTLRKTL
jgi:tartrate-resistant acid phosphatase type 5